VEPLELKAETTSCLIFVMFSLFLALVGALLCCIMEAWSGVLVSLAVPLPSLLWQQWQRRRSVIFYQDHLVDRTWFSTKIVSYAGTEAELRTRVTRFARVPNGGGHLPVLVLRRNGNAVASVPRGLAPGPEDLRRITELLRNAGVPIRRLV